MAEENDFYKRLLDNLYDAVYAVDRHRRITYWNRGAEHLTGFSGSEVLGRHCHDNVLMHVDEEGRSLCHTACPLTKAMEEGGPNEAGAYLHHREGHRVPISVRCSPVHDASGNVSGGIEVFRDDSPRLEMEELRRQALLDPLTNAGNRRYAEMVLNSRLGEMRRHEWSFGVAFIDIDHFKEINDNYGHDVGDLLLKMVSRTIMNTLRSFNFLGRWGGEEFVAVISHVDEEQLQISAERLRSLVAQSILPRTEGYLHVTISIGATLARPDDTAESLVNRADGLMYASKEAGRNRVTA
jgi:diguanylate cyclase (GGDEF)-like protein/PAS domain S-box-containing protein